jgi:hypothetical protein
MGRKKNQKGEYIGKRQRRKEEKEREERKEREDEDLEVITVCALPGSADILAS